jgi:hypothetical protein
MRSIPISSAQIAMTVIGAAHSLLAVDDVVETSQPATAPPKGQSGIAGGKA